MYYTLIMERKPESTERTIEQTTEQNKKKKFGWDDLAAGPQAEQYGNEQDIQQDAVEHAAYRALLRLVCKDVFELAAVDEASLDVAGGVGEAHGVAAQGLEPAVDGFGGSVA